MTQRTMMYEIQTSPASKIAAARLLINSSVSIKKRINPRINVINATR